MTKSMAIAQGGGGDKAGGCGGGGEGSGGGGHALGSPHLTPASSEWTQLCEPQPRKEHAESDDSVPEHRTSSIKIDPAHNETADIHCGRTIDCGHRLIEGMACAIRLHNAPEPAPKYARLNAA